MPTGTFISYYRVSTARQGRSGLGLDAQKHAVHEYLNGGSWVLAQEFVEIESGKRSDRPQLAAALAACRLHKATLVIAKLDRLARNVAFVSALMEAGVDFVACDLPTANRLTIHILAAVAEHEALAISERTKAALSAARARGTVLGGYRGRPGTSADCERARATQKAFADQRARDLAATVQTIQSEGHLSLRSIGRQLALRGIPTSRGGAWSSSQVRNMLARIVSVQNRGAAQ
ncbi:DNA invertase Pin-like site-specific DNA recombinase [Bosea sp. BE125]|uniref:recombinase family protein n=1 Tax=Bosea sp. BE125 TaxID=2817909 RepID=UPI002865EDB2|nr:recombinase family protein [Bosea sp. BE125]MDR6873560.1 DNA invertase Pin-like site-specific DNA recombinase [Bosea sp. BE125]